MTTHPGKTELWCECERLLALAEEETGQLHGAYLACQAEAMEAIEELFLYLPRNTARLEEFVHMAMRMIGLCVYRRPGLPDTKIQALLESLYLLPLNEQFTLYVEAVAAFVEQMQEKTTSTIPLDALALNLEQLDREAEDPFACLLAGLIHCRTCTLLRAMECYENYIIRYTGGNHYFHQLFCLNIGIAALNLGKYSMSYGIIESFRNTHELTGSNYLSLSWKRHLVFLLVRMGRLDEGIVHLDQLLAVPQLSGKLAYGSMLSRALALYHYMNSKPDKAIQALRADAQTFTGADPHSLFFTDPTFFEMLYELRLHGEEHITGYDLKTVLARAEQGVNQLLRGIALRIRGQNLHEAGQTEQAIAAFEESLESLKNTGCVEAVQRASIAYRLLLREQDRQTDEKRVRDMVDAYVAALTEQDSSDSEQPETALDGVRRCLLMLENISATDSLTEKLSRLVGIVRRTLGAQRAALFSITPGGGFEAVGTSNLTAVELASATFKRVMEYLVLEMGHVSASRPSLPCREGRALGLAIFTEHGNPQGDSWLLYLDNDLNHEILSTMSPQAGELLSSVLGAELRAIVRGSDRKRAVTELQPVQRTLAPAFWGEGMANVLREAELVATSESSVLIRGETGVGKERLAHYIHEQSGCLGSFVPVQLACLPEQLFESELFGHEKGAFTGAIRSKPGRAELANQGVLFLDEVGDMPLYFQVKLLRFLQEREFTRVGGTRPIQTNFRLIAATHKDLQEEVRQGRFREDLYYRLAVITLNIPPLRERRQDIPALAESFRRYYSQLGTRRDADTPTSFSHEIKQTLMQYNWPGNIRELQNMMERAVTLRTEPHISETERRTACNADEFGRNQYGKHHQSKNAEYQDISPLIAVLQSRPTLETLQEAYIRHVLEETNGKVHGPHGALSVLGMKKTTFYSRIKGRNFCQKSEQ